MLVTTYITTLGWPLPERRDNYLETGKMQNVGSESEHWSPPSSNSNGGYICYVHVCGSEITFQNYVWKRIWNLTISGLATYFFYAFTLW